MGVCHGPCSLAGDSPPFPHPATDPPGRVWPVPPVEGERHTLQTLKPGGFNQWLPTTQNPSAELRIGAVKATVWENEVGGITRPNVTFSRIYRDGDQWKTTHSFGFSNLLSVAKLADQGTHAHCRAQGRGGQRGWR